MPILIFADIFKSGGSAIVTVGYNHLILYNKRTNLASVAIRILRPHLGHPQITPVKFQLLAIHTPTNLQLLIIVRLIHIPLYASLWSLLKLLRHNLHTLNQSIGRKLRIKKVYLLLYLLYHCIRIHTIRLAKLYIGIDKGNKLAPFIHHKRFHHIRKVVYHTLYLLRIDILPRRSKYHIFAAAFDKEITILIHNTHITCLHPAILCKGGVRCLRILVIPKHHIITLNLNLSRYGGRIFGIYPYLHSWGRLATGEEFIL